MHQASVNTVTCTRYGKDSELLGGSLSLVSLLRRRNFLVPQILLVAIAINFGTGTRRNLCTIISVETAAGIALPKTPKPSRIYERGTPWGLM